MAAPRICSVDGCSKDAKTRGWCHAHYHRWQRYSDPLGGTHFADNSGECSVTGCTKSAHARGFCCNHYYHWRRYGDPLVSAQRDEGEPLKWLKQNVGHEDKESCLIWPFALSGEGRPSVRVDGKTRIASREMCRLAHGEPPSPEHHAAHSCGKGDFGCINPHHLRWATPAENEGDKVEHGTSNRGERHGLAKLTEAKARQIRELKGILSQRKTAKLFGVSRGAINDIWTGRTWEWLE